jgi:hypothetical protein
MPPLRGSAGTPGLLGLLSSRVTEYSFPEMSVHIGAQCLEIP